VKTLHLVQEIREAFSSAPRPLVLVPTMGALHAGHCSLLTAARSLAGTGGTVVATIFVNPTQFGPKEDLAQYPRPFEADQELCAAHGADYLFAPTAEEMYSKDFSTWVNEESVSLGLCGGSRPGHFRGVCTVVLKLFLICQPTHAVFGQKDFQQCAVITRMVRDLNVPVSIILAPTVRAPDGLALSSRNAYLSEDERRQAIILHSVLEEAKSMVRNGITDTAQILSVANFRIASCPLARADYVSLVDGASLQPIQSVAPGCVLALAVFFGKTRLIDNAQLL